ncbi:MAG: ATP-binding protein [Pseudomonadota bacterium]
MPFRRRTTETHVKTRFKASTSLVTPSLSRSLNGIGVLAGTLAATFFGTRPAAAEGLFFGGLSSTHVLAYAAFVATLGFAIVSTFILMRERRRIALERDRLVEELADNRARADRIETLLAIDDQRLVIWPSPNARPTILGTLPDRCGAPTDKAAFLAFGKWLDASSAHQLQEAITALRESGMTFQMAAVSKVGSYIDVFGRTVGGRIFLRFRDLSGDKRVRLELERTVADRTADLNAFKTLFDAIRQPVWLRKAGDDEGEAIIWSNRAYQDATGHDPDADLPYGELLDSEAREEEVTTHGDGNPFTNRVHAVSAGQRSTFDVVSVPTENGSIGIATDVSEAEKAQSALNRTISNHEKTLNELPTAIAIFDKSRKLTFYNQAYRILFGLSEAFLDSQPSDSELIDKFRALEKIPVEANFREWKRNLLKTHQSLDVSEFTWHLPDGKTLRVIASPHTSGGVTWIYEDVTTQINLESRVNVLSRLQAETLNRLSDGVAVFSSDGLLTLSNTSFLEQWGLDETELTKKPHINNIAAACVTRYANEPAWHALKMAIVGVMDKPEDTSGTMERPDGSVVQFATASLIDGRTMVTFVDITDSVNFERALTEKNEALEQADKLKSDFVQHVSYELRSPLTNIIGFAQLLSDADMGPLTDKQQEYTDYILSSSSSLLAIINDILDLATADAGVLELALGEVAIRSAVDHAIEGLQDRLTDREIMLDLDVPEDIGAFIGDERRITQILFNLLSNAIQFSDDGSKVAVKVRRSEDSIVFTVQDWGAGIPDVFIENVFGRFESRKAGQARGGAGLGLSIVKRFVELHEGTVAIESAEGVGTTVICTIPAEPKRDEIAAE